MRGGPRIERRDVRGSPVAVGNGTVTPVARSLVVRWPGGGAVWSGPAAVIVERKDGIERIPVEDVNSRILRAMRVGAVALVAGWIARDRSRRKSDD